MILDHFALSHICDNCPERVKDGMAHLVNSPQHAAFASQPAEYRHPPAAEERKQTP